MTIRTIICKACGLKVTFVHRQGLGRKIYCKSCSEKRKNAARSAWACGGYIDRVLRDDSHTDYDNQPKQQD